MTIPEADQREERTQNETLIIAQTDQGYRVCSPLKPATQYVVSGIPDAPQCTCPDYEYHRSELGWRCKHILAVLQSTTSPQRQQAEAEADAGPANAAAPKQQENRQRKLGPARNGQSQMLLKRSVSPDGRIDSLSVEFSCPVASQSLSEIKEKAENTMALQSAIVASFLQRNGNPQSRPATPPAEPSEAVPAQMLSMSAQDTKWGRRLFIAVQVNGQTIKLFGTPQQLAAHVTAAGFASVAPHLQEGMDLNLPCRVVTKPSKDGRYLNIEHVYPIQPAPTEKAAL